MPLHSSSGPRPTSSEAERIFYRALAKELPRGWTAWHSLRLRAGATWEGEGDFVLAVPDRAILIIEVKGGAVECRDGQWLQSGAPMKQAPRDQAHRLRRILERRLGEMLGTASPTATAAPGMSGARDARPFPPILIATAFPQTPFQVPPSHGDLAAAVLGQQDLPWLGSALEALVDKQLGDAPPTKDRGWTSALHKLWGETWVPRVSLGTRIQLRERELVPLDADQVALLDLLEHSERLLVTGGPGTGKTLLARELCVRRPPALYLCWTRALAAAVRASGIAEAWPVREYAATLLARAGIGVDGAPAGASDTWSPEVWNTVALAAAVDAVPATREHRIVVVDEAQDFTESEWELTTALADGRSLWAFGDAGQSFWPERAVPAGLFGASLALKARYRCPAALAAFADRYRDDVSAAANAAREADAPFPELRVVECRDGGASQAERVKTEVTRALRDGARPGDIAILSLCGQTKSALFKERRLGDVDVVHADAPDASEHVVADTFLRFKGLERPYVIVTELDVPRNEKYAVRMHVALTRATLQAVVVATTAQLEADERLRAVT